MTDDPIINRQTVLVVTQSHKMSQYITMLLSINYNREKTYRLSIICIIHTHAYTYLRLKSSCRFYLLYDNNILLTQCDFWHCLFSARESILGLKLKRFSFKSLWIFNLFLYLFKKKLKCKRIAHIDELSKSPSSVLLRFGKSLDSFV